MSVTRLNLLALRAQLWPRLRPKATAAGAPETTGAGSGLSRRELLGVAGLLAVSLLPGTRNIRLPWRGAFKLAGDERRLALLLGGHERFVISTDQFAGSPALRLTEQEEGYRIELTGARYPGTEVPADLTADLSRAAAGWVMRLRMAFAGFDTIVPLEPWLAGEEPARSTASVSAAVCRMTGGACLAAGGTVRAEFRPDWTLRLTGQGIGRFAGLAGDLSGDTLLLSLLSPFDSSIMRRPAARRSLLTVERGGQNWSLLPALSGLSGAAQAFDTLHVEAGESVGGRVRHALVAEGEGTLEYRPAGSLTLDGSPLALTLTGPRFAAAPGEKGEEAVLTARFAGRPVWVKGPGIHALVGGTPEAEPFTAVWRDGAPAQVTCAAPVLAAAAPLEDAVTQVHVPEKTRLVFAPAAGTVRVLPPTQTWEPMQMAFTTLTVIRPTDMLNLTFEGRNLVFEGDGQGGNKLVRKTAGQPAYLIVHFPPQHIAEETFPLTGPDTITGATSAPAKARMAGPSRLVFALPQDYAGIPYTLTGLLSWESLVPAVASAAKAGSVTGTPPSVPAAYLPAFPASPSLAPPAAEQTAIEAPYRLFLSPNQYSAWAHIKTPVTFDGWTELWHTRLGVRGANNTVEELSRDYRKVRAVWASDYTTYQTDQAPFPMALEALDRYRIVRRTANWSDGTPLAVPVNRLMLSPLGAWLDLHGTWPESAANGLREWRHQATQGRDQFVKVATDGFLFPFRHAATYVEIAERRIITRDGKKVAYLTSRKYIVVKEPEIDYSVEPGLFPKQGREWPLKRVRLLTKVTPYLDNVTLSKSILSKGEAAFWPKIQDAHCLFKAIAIDTGGNEIFFAAPMAFLAVETCRDTAVIDAAIAGLGQGVGTVDLGGQRLHFADSAIRGDTEFEAKEIVVGGARPQSQPAGKPLFYPLLKEASVRLPAMAHLTGNEPGHRTVKLAARYLDAGMGATNKGEVFLELVSATSMTMPPKVSGGLVGPKFTVSGISRKVGLVGGNLDSFAGGTYTPSAIFDDANATLLGGIKLTKLLPAIAPAEFAARIAEIPKIKTHLTRTADGRPNTMETSFAWAAPVQNVTEGFVEFVKTDQTRLRTDVKVISQFASTAKTHSVTSSLNNFSIKLMGAVRVQFTQLEITMLPGQKPAVKVNLAGVHFEGALSWVAVLTQFMSKFGLGGFDINISSSELKMVQSVGPLNIQLGMLALMDVNVRTQLTLPFLSGKAASLAFSFGSEDAPCGLTVSFLGGQAYFRLTVSTNQLEVAAMFGFGGCIAFDIGVASGKAEIMACIMFVINTDNQVIIEGSLRCTGALRVLKIITISVVFIMALRYEGGKVIGSCQVKVKVSIAFFEKTVSLRLERKFAGSPGDPTFADLMAPEDWQAYCLAFA